MRRKEGSHIHVEAIQTRGAAAQEPATIRLVREGPVPRANCPHCGGGLDLGATGTAWQVTRPSDIADRLMLQLGALEREELHVLLLDAKNVVTAQVRVYEGNASSAVVRIAELFTEAVRRQASAVILCHNHPSGDPTPSPDDLHLTAEAIAAGRLLDLDVLDHVIVGSARWTSLRERGVAFDRRPRAASVAEAGAAGKTALRVDADGRVVDADGTVYSVEEAIEALSWRSALPSSGAPHQYTVLGRSGPRLAFDVVAAAIARHPDSYMAYHRGYRRPMRYLEFGGWRLWRSAAGHPGGVTHMLNRCLPASDTPRRVDQGARPMAWDGPPWLEFGSPWPSGWIEDPRGEYGRIYHPELDVRRNYPCTGCGRRFFWAPGRLCPSCGTRVSEQVD